MSQKKTLSKYTKYVMWGTVALIDSFKAFDTGSTEHITVQVHILPVF